jgi:hypothetical protein
VDPSKIRIVPEGIDTAVWDPARYKPVNISKLALQQATGRRYGWVGEALALQRSMED